MAKKKSKRKFQIKNVDSGNYMRLQDKYSKTKKAKQTRHIGYLRKKLKDKMKLDKLRLFNGFSILVYVYLRDLRMPMAFHIKQFQLIEEDTPRMKELCFKDEDKFEWLKEIETALFEAVMSIQILVLIPKSQWLLAIENVEHVEQIPVNKVREALFILIGKLQDLENENTKGIDIPDKYHDDLGGRAQHYHDAFKIEKLTTFNELHLIGLVAKIVGDEEGLHCRELQELLDITLEMENLYRTIGFTKNKYKLHNGHEISCNCRFCK